MKRIFLAVWLAVFAVTGLATAPAQQQPYGGGLKGLTGDYAVQMTGAKLIAGTVHLTQVGNTIVGSAESAKGSGVLQINGTVQGDKVSGKWRGPTGETGWITLNFNKDGTAFNGTYGYGGRAANGSIVSRKIRTTAF
jgi:hypothetical protein